MVFHTSLRSAQVVLPDQLVQRRGSKDQAQYLALSHLLAAVLAVAADLVVKVAVLAVLAVADLNPGRVEQVTRHQFLHLRVVMVVAALAHQISPVAAAAVLVQLVEMGQPEQVVMAAMAPPRLSLVAL